MRVIVVWCVAIIMLLSVSIGYYITLPVCFTISTQIDDMAVGSGLTALRIVEYVLILWGPLWCVFIVLWAFLESHRQDISSVTYGG